MPNQEMAQQFLAKVKAKAKDLMSDEGFTVDGTLIEAWTSHKSFQHKDGGASREAASAPASIRASKTTKNATGP